MEDQDLKEINRIAKSTSENEVSFRPMTIEVDDTTGKVNVVPLEKRFDENVPWWKWFLEIFQGIIQKIKKLLSP